jgi:hypothetical protein
MGAGSVLRAGRRFLAARAAVIYALRVDTSIRMADLAARFRDATFEAFVAEYPHAWMIWEPGPWQPVAPDQINKGTQIGERPKRRGSGAGAKALPLLLKPGLTELSLGRDPECGVWINDATLSRAHLRLLRAGERWQVRDLGSMNGSYLAGERLDASAHDLIDGAQLEAGSVILTFHEPHGLYYRLRTTR